MTAFITPSSSTILLPTLSSSPKSAVDHTNSEQSLGISASMSSLPDAKHWSQQMHESVVSSQVIEQFYSKISGGSDNGQFPYFDSSLKTISPSASISSTENDECKHVIPMLSGKIFADEIILEIQGQKISGYTLYDVISCLKKMATTYDTITFCTVKTASQSNTCLQSSLQNEVMPNRLIQMLPNAFAYALTMLI